MDFDGARTEDMAGDEADLIIDDAQPAGELHDDLLELHVVRSGRGPLQADYVRHVDKAFHEPALHGGTRRVGVVDDDSDVSRIGGGGDELVEVVFGRLEVERRRNLDVFGAYSVGRASQRCQLSRAGGLRAHHDRDPSTGFFDHRRGHFDALVQGHRAEAASGAASEQHAVAGPQSTIEQKANMAADAGEVDREAAVHEESGHGYVAAGKASASDCLVHAVAGGRAPSP